MSQPPPSDAPRLPSRDPFASTDSADEARRTPSPQSTVAAPGYVFLEVLGEGGMGQVFKARQTRLDRVVAVKVIRPDRLLDEHAVERFRQEARAAARLQHPNIVAVHDADEHRGIHFLVLEYVAGVSLNRLLKKGGPLPVYKACDYARQAALGLAHAHQQGLVHRDVKPSNLILGEDGVVKVVDFGLARVARETQEGAALTPTGAILGTPDYLAPEQARDPRAVDGRADVYGLGCTLFALIAGHPPYEGATMAEKLAAHLDDEPPPRLDEVRPDVPPALADVVAKMMAKRPDDRFASGAEVARALEPFAIAPVRRSRKRRSRKRRWPWLVGAAALLLVGVGGAIVAVVLHNWPRGGPAPLPVAPAPVAPSPDPVAEAAKDKPDPPDAPPPAGGEPAFDEHFDGKGVYLHTEDSSKQKCYFQDGRYVVEMPPGGFFGMSLPFGPALWDFACEVQFGLEGGEMEMDFRERMNQTSSTKVVFRINPAGSFILKREFFAREGTLSRTVDTKDLLAGAPAGEPIHEELKSLRIVASGETIDVYLNGKLVRQGRDAYRPEPNAIGNPFGLMCGIFRTGEATSAKLSLGRMRIWRLAAAKEKDGP